MAHYAIVPAQHGWAPSLPDVAALIKVRVVRDRHRADCWVNTFMPSGMAGAGRRNDQLSAQITSPCSWAQSHSHRDPGGTELMQLGFTVRASYTALRHPVEGIERIRGRVDARSDKRELMTLSCPPNEHYAIVEDW